MEVVVTEGEDTEGVVTEGEDTESPPGAVYVAGAGSPAGAALVLTVVVAGHFAVASFRVVVPAAHFRAEVAMRAQVSVAVLHGDRAALLKSVEAVDHRWSVREVPILARPPLLAA